MKLATSLLLACLLLAGCEEPKLPKSWRVTYARVLAVRSEVVGDERRATPYPGDRVRVRVLIVGDEPIQQLSYALIACSAAPARGELPGCFDEPFFAEQEQLDGAASLARELVVELDVPTYGDFVPPERLLIGGTICTEGTPELVEGGEGRCEGSDVPPVSFAAHVVLERDDPDRNSNPILADDAIRFDGDVWAPQERFVLPAEGDAGVDDDAGIDAELPDAGAALAARADGKRHEIAISLKDSARETSEVGPEELLLSHFVTGGVLGRRFSVLEREQDGGEPFRVKWHMPVQPDAPSRVLAVFVLRDQRGGVAYALRELAIE